MKSNQFESPSPKKIYNQIYFSKLYKALLTLFALCASLSILFLILSYQFANPKETLTIATICKISSTTISFPNLPNYTDVIIAVIIAIGIALLSIDATIFIFSKSALDRFNDENRYIERIARIHKEQTIQLLFINCIISVFFFLLPLLWHFIVSFHDYFNCYLFCLALGLFIISAIIYILLSFDFLNKCVNIEEYLRKIIRKNYKTCAIAIENYLPHSDENERLNIIGDWISWDDDNYGKSGRDLCNDMSADQFINSFQKAERLLIPNGSSEEPSLQKVKVVTTFQERQSMLNSSASIDIKDLKDRYYFNKEGNTDNILECIKQFERKVKYSRLSNNEKLFFKETEDIYTVLKEYCNLLISDRFTKATDNTNTELAETINLPMFAEAFYSFYIRILSVFVSSVYISDYSFNDSSLNYANFYNSTLENISLYGASFYRTILSRTTFKKVIMDLSVYEDVDFYSSILANSSLNNSIMTQVRFDRAVVENSGFDTCDFYACQFIDCDFSNCNFNNTKYFDKVILKNSDFVNSKFRDLKIHNATFESCSFIDSEFFNWSTEIGLHMDSCDFSKSVWSEMELNNWILSDCIFKGATLAGIRFLNTKMVASDFSECILAESQLSNCNINKSDLKKASLFNAHLDNVDLSMADLSLAKAVKAKFRYKCSLRNTNCDDADFSEAEFTCVDLEAARLYNCAFTRSIIQNTNCKYLLADKMQFTFATCDNTDFSYGSLSDSNMTSTSFSECKFIGADLSQTNATKTRFKNCILLNTDFSDTRFVETQFRGANPDKPMLIVNCDFSGCKFEKVSFKNVSFINCIFTDSIMMKCKNSDGDLIEKDSAEDYFGSDWNSITFYNKSVDARED